MFEVEVSEQVQDIFREYCLAFCLALRPADIARGFQAQAPRPVEPVPLGALISASQTLQAATLMILPDEPDPGPLSPAPEPRPIHNLEAQP